MILYLLNYYDNIYHWNLMVLLKILIILKLIKFVEILFLLLILWEMIFYKNIIVLIVKKILWII